MQLRDDLSHEQESSFVSTDSELTDNISQKLKDFGKEIDCVGYEFIDSSLANSLCKIFTGVSKDSDKQFSYKERYKIFENLGLKWEALNYQIMRKAPSTFKNRFDKVRLKVVELIKEYFDQPMIRPEDFYEQVKPAPSKYNIDKIKDTLMDIISDECGWLSDKVNDDPIPPHVESKLAELNQLLNK